MAEPLTFPLMTSRWTAPTLAEWPGGKVGITVGQPRMTLAYPRHDHIVSLGPNRSFLHTPLDEYAPLYYAKLDAHGIDKITARLTLAWERCGSPLEGLALLCFEDLSKPDLWCHRRLFASWWEVKTGTQVPEYEVLRPYPIPYDGPPQTELNLTRE